MRLAILLHGLFTAFILATEISPDFLVSEFSKHPHHFLISLAFRDVALMINKLVTTVKKLDTEKPEHSLIEHKHLLDVYNKYLADNFIDTMNALGQFVNVTNSINPKVRIMQGVKKQCEDTHIQAYLHQPVANTLAAMIICPHNGFLTTPSIGMSASVSQLTCKDFPEGSKVTTKMRPSAFYILRALMRWPTLVKPLEEIKDYADGPWVDSIMDKERAVKNADSYAWFVTEAYWTLECGYKFELAEFVSDDDDYAGQDYQAR